MKTEVIEITPEVARVYLKQNTNNRNLIKRKLAQYAKDMKEGRWVLNGEPIQFDDSGELINGQHRLNACIRSNSAFTTLVVFGVSGEEMGDAIYMARMRKVRMKKDIGMNQNDEMFMIMKAYQYHVKGKKIEKMYIPETMPNL